MNRDWTDITMVIDRSGSMDLIRDDAEGGVNAFIADQAQQPGQCTLTLVQFDYEYEFVHRGIDIKECPRYQLQPRGSTALFDAVGRAINETGSRLAALPEDDRPGLVVFVISTDGQENASHEYPLEQVRQMIEHQQSVYQWQFTFLAANAEAFAQAWQMGVDQGGSACYGEGQVYAANKVTSNKVLRMRVQASRGETVVNAFSDEEREQMS